MSDWSQDVGGAAVDLTSTLVAIDSVNPGLAAGAAGESAIVEHLRTRLDRTGFTTRIVQSPGRDGRPSLVAVGPGPDTWPTVVLNGHVDTVGVAGMAAPFEPRVDGDRLRGRGAADMKGGIAAMVVAAETLVAHGAPVRLVLALVADEEDANVGSEAVIAALPGMGVRPDVCVIAEPTDLALARSLRGFAVVGVRFTGRAAHSSQPDLGINAVTSLGRFLDAVDRAAPRVRAEGGDLMVTLVRGGDSAFVIPDPGRVPRRAAYDEQRLGSDRAGRGRGTADPRPASPDRAGGQSRRLATRHRRHRRCPRRPARRGARQRADFRRALLDGGPALAGRVSDGDLRPLGRRAARG